MASAGVWVFFYGTIMNPSVLNEYGVTPIHVSPGKLNGFDLNTPAARYAPWSGGQTSAHDTQLPMKRLLVFVC